MLVSMWIAVVSYKILNRAFKLIKMSYFKYFEINLNIIIETIVFSFCAYI